MSSFYLQQFWVLFLLIPAIAIIAYTRSKSSSYWLLALQILGVVLLIIGIAHPITVKQQQVQNIIVAVDRSESITAKDQAAFSEALTKLKLPTEVQYLPFAGSVGSVVGSLADSYQVDLPNVQSSNLENIINSFPRIPIILLSDGQENAGDAIGHLHLKGRPAPIFPIILPGSQAASGVELEKLVVPLLSDAGIRQDLQVLVKNFSDQQLTGDLLVKQEGQEIVRENLNLRSGQTLNYAFTSKELQPGLNHFEAEIVGSKQQVESLEFFVTAKEKNKVLILSSVESEAKLLTKILLDQKYNAESFAVAQGQIPNLDLSKFQILFLNNIPYNALPNQLVKQIAPYLANGGSMMMLGGNKSFGLGGYKDTEIEQVLPVNVLDPEKIQQRVNVAVSLVLDKSGSMKGASKLDYTKLAAKAVLDVLKDDDYFGMVGFDNQPFIALNMQQLKSGGRDKAMKRVDLLFPNGGTNLYPAMDIARQELELAAAGRKHLIILTDGRLPDESYLGSNYVNLARSLKTAGVSVSTFLIGNDDSKILREIASFGGGKFHQTMDAQTLPRLFLEDVRVNTAEKTQKEFEEYPVIKSAAAANRLTKISSFPSLLGYVETKPKNDIQLELITKAVNDDPILAGWEYQGGRVVAFTSDLSGRWSKNWISWPLVYDFWEQVLSYLTPNRDGELFTDFDFDYHLKGQRLQFNLTTYQSSFAAGDFRLEMQWPDQTKEDLGFINLTKGYFQATVNAPTSGVAEARLHTPDNKVHVFKINLPDPEKLERPMGANVAFLNSVASLSGGEVNPKELNLSSVSQSTEEKTSWQKLLLILSLIILTLSVIYREKTSSAGLLS